MIHLNLVKMIRNKPYPRTYPFSVPTISTLEQISFTSPVTFFVGENGTGKSTLLEAIAAAIGSIRVGESIQTDVEMKPARELAKFLKLTSRLKTRKGFFLRAEDFITYIKQLTNLRKEMEQELIEVEKTFKNKSQLSRQLAEIPYKRSLYEMESMYEGKLEQKSHGESFLQFFQSRFQPKGLYLLDEPETPLSPFKQIAFLAMLKQMVEQDAQFIIATHSPIIMAYPGATIYSFDQVPPSQVSYHELEHVKLTRDFLNAPQQFFQHL